MKLYFRVKSPLALFSIAANGCVVFLDIDPSKLDQEARNLIADHLHEDRICNGRGEILTMAEATIESILLKLRDEKTAEARRKAARQASYPQTRRDWDHQAGLPDGPN